MKHKFEENFDDLGQFGENSLKKTLILVLWSSDLAILCLFELGLVFIFLILEKWIRAALH